MMAFDEWAALPEAERRELARRLKIAAFRRGRKDSMVEREKKSRAHAQRVDREWQERLANAQTPEERERLTKTYRKQLRDRARRMERRIQEENRKLGALLARLDAEPTPEQGHVNG